MRNNEKTKSWEEQRIDEIINGADDYDFDPKAAGYEELVDGDGIWWSDVGEWSDTYVETSQLSSESKKTAKKGENFYWLHKKSFSSVWFKFVLGYYLFLAFAYLCFPKDLTGMKNLALISLAFILIITFLIFVVDAVYFTYFFDVKMKKTKVMNLEIWHLADESDFSLLAFGDASRYFPASLRIIRGYICFHDLSKKTRPLYEKVMNGLQDDVIIKKKDRKGLLKLRIVFTAKKWQLFKKLREFDPDMQYEVEYYKTSKVIKEIRPIAGKEYSPVALEILYLINRMYP